MPPTETAPLPLGDPDAALVFLLRTRQGPAFKETAR
jgi:hypothetical protein